MSDQKNPSNTAHTATQNQKPNQATNQPNSQASKQTPQDSERVGGDAARTQAAKPQDRTTEQPGRATKPDIQAGKK